LLILCIQPVENHFLNWIWNKVRNVFDPTKSHRLFDCGKSDIPQILPSKMDTPRITGGLSAADHSFPWMVNVINLKSLKSCGGAIIGPDTIITGNYFLYINPLKKELSFLAAHCIVDEAKYLSVIAGASNLFGRLNVFNYHAVSHVIIHPDYVSCCDYDIAIIKLKKRLQRSEMINSICLPNEKNQELKSETIAFIAGWGGKYPTSELNTFGSFHLKQGLVYIKSNDYCKQIYNTFDENDEICATNTRDHVDSRGNCFSFYLSLFVMICFMNLSIEFKMNNIIFKFNF
jgi:hypothetical protein